MYVIRRNPETASSSIHAIVIDLDELKLVKESEWTPTKYTKEYQYNWWANYHLIFGLGEFYTKFEEVDRHSYLWTYIVLSTDADVRRKIRNNIRKMLKPYGITCEFKNVANIGKYDYGIDHSDELDHTSLGKFIDYKTGEIKDEELLMKYLMGFRSCVFTGYDNHDVNPEEMFSVRSLKAKGMKCEFKGN